MALRPARIHFGPFHLHPTQGLGRGDHEIRVTPKALAVLQALVEQAGQIVTKEDLFRQVWPRSVVTEAALSSCILELRRALQDDARHPRYIETVHRRGFRLLPACRYELGDAGVTGATDWAPRAVEPLVGRASELDTLAKVASRVHAGSSEVVLVAGPTGIGKTTLVQGFLGDFAQRQPWPICRTTCSEQSGAGDAYRPLLDALERLCLGPEGSEVVATLRRSAPTWLSELRAVLSPEETRTLRQRTGGATPKRLMRELCDALTAITARTPLVLVIENIHWCDAATLDWIASVARSAGDASIVLVTTCRPPDTTCTQVLGSTIRDLRDSAHGTLIELQSLSQSAVGEYLSRRLAARSSLDRLAASVHLHTLGHPLFMQAVVDELLARGPDLADDREAVAALDLPVDFAALIELQLKRLTDTQRSVLELASVAGDRFSSAELEAASDLEPSEVQAVLGTLVRAESFIRPGSSVIWPDGTTSAAFEFTHASYRAALLERLAPPTRAVLHRRIGRRLLAGHRECAEEIACELAAHFERGGDTSRAVKYLYHAGTVSRRRAAHSLALSQFRRALALLPSLPAASDRDEWEALLRVTLGRETITAEGTCTAEVDECYARALELQKTMHAPRSAAAILWRLWVFYLNRGPLETARQVADRLLEIAEELDDPALLLEACHAQWGTAAMAGEVDNVLDWSRRGMAVCGAKADGALAMTSGCTLHDVHLNDHHAAVCAGFFAAWGDALAGRKDAAARSLDAAITHARDVGHPFTLAVTLVFAAAVFAALDDPGTCDRYAQEGRALAQDQGFNVPTVWATVYAAWARARLGDSGQGIAMLRTALATYRATGLAIFRAFQLSLAADVELRSGMLEESAQSLEEGLALVERVGHRLALAELYRIRGELSWTRSNDPASRDQAEIDLRTAVQIASVQGASLFAARASASLQRMLGSAGERAGSLVFLKRTRDKPADG